MSSWCEIKTRDYYLESALFSLAIWVQREASCASYRMPMTSHSFLKKKKQHRASIATSFLLLLFFSLAMWQQLIPASRNSELQCSEANMNPWPFVSCLAITEMLFVAAAAVLAGGKIWCPTQLISRSTLSWKEQGEIQLFPSSPVQPYKIIIKLLKIGYCNVSNWPAGDATTYIFLRDTQFWGQVL